MAVLTGFIFSCQRDPADGERSGAPLRHKGGVERNIAYGEHPRQRMDVYFPDNYTEETPVVFLIHGGAFVAGAKEDFFRPAQLFLKRDFVVVNLSYRLADTSGMYGLPPSHHKSNVSIVQQVADVAQAVNVFVSRAREWGIDTAQMYMAGHSAGGTLALLYCEGTYNRQGRIKACGNWAGVTDLTIPDDRLARMVQPYVRELLYCVAGADPLQRNNDAFRLVSPYWVINDSSHLTPVISIYPEQNYVFHYPGEAAIGLNHTKALHRLLQTRGIAEKLSVYTGSNHSFNFNEQTWEKLIGETASFFRSQAVR